MTASEKTPTSRRRRLVIGSNVLAQVLIVFVVMFMINWLVSRHYQRWDWTTTRYYALSDKTKQTLAALTEPVQVVVFIPPSSIRDYVEKVLQDVRDLLNEFALHARGKLTVEYVDPQRDLARARQLVEQFKLDSPDVVIFARSDRHKFVRLDELVELEYGNPYLQQAPRIKAFKGEGLFLAALQSVVEEQPPRVVFLTGHGERDPDDFDQQHGYSDLARYIRRDNIQVEKCNLLETGEVPTNAAAIIIAGPRQRFTEPELAALQNYLRNQGRLFVLLDPRYDAGLVPFLESWGVTVDNNLVMARGGRLLGTELLLVDALGATYAPHPITKSLQGVNTSFAYARSVRARNQAEMPAADQPFVTELVRTPPAFWGETDLDAQRSTFDPATDLPGPLSLAVAVEKGRPRDVNVELGSSRLVVVGTSSFVDNRHVEVGGSNLDFFMNALNWLLQREQLVAVGPKTPTEFSLNMSVQQVRAVYALVVAGLPLGVGALGVLVWLRRRK